jgi:hypothetical protein
MAKPPNLAWMAQTLAVVEYPITITPYKEDSKYWYVIENTNGDILMLYGI